MPNDVKNESKKKIGSFLANLEIRYKKKSYHIERILNDTWSNSNFKLPVKFNEMLKNRNFLILKAAVDVQEEQDAENTSSSFQASKSNKRRGRKLKPFELKTKRSQLAMAQEIRKKYPQGAIKLAFEQGLKFDAQENPKKKNLAFIIKKCSSSTGLTACIAKKAISSKQDVVKKTPEEALFFILTNGLSKNQYKSLKKTSRESGFDIWPNYDYVRDAKINLRPEGISFQKDGSITVPLQELLEKTLSRTLLNNTPLYDKLLDLADERGGELNMCLIYKLGFDSSGAHEVAQ